MHECQHARAIAEGYDGKPDASRNRCTFTLRYLNAGLLVDIQASIPHTLSAMTKDALKVI